MTSCSSTNFHTVTIKTRMEKKAMVYDEEQAKRSRVVVQTPSSTREVVESESVRTPERSGISAGMVGVLVVVAIALITVLVLFWMSNQQTNDANANLANDDSTIQAAIDKQLADDPTLSTLGITATVMNGKVTLLGSVKNDGLKNQVEKMARRIKGVKAVDNQISVIAG